MLHRLLTLYNRSGSGFNPNSIAGLRQLLLSSTAPSLSGIIYDERSGLGTARARQPGRAYDFDGVNDYITLGSTVSFTGDFTISYWVNLDVITFSDKHFGHNSNNTIDALNTTTLRVEIDGTTHSFTLPSAMSTGTWCNLMIVRSSGTITVYKDLGASGTNSDSDTFTLSILGAESAGVSILNGRIFDVRFYDKALSSEERTYVYNFGSTGTDPTATNLLAHYKCDDTHPTVAYDSSGNGNNGTKSNITASTFHHESNTVPYSFQNEVGYSDRQNYVKQSHNLSDSVWSKSGVTVAESAEFWVLTRTNVAPGAAVQSNIIPDTDDYVISLTLRAGSSSRISIGLFTGGWNLVDYEIVSGSGSVSGVGTLATISGLDSNDTVLKLQYKPGAALADLYIYPDSSVGSGVAGSTNLVKDIQVYKGTLATTQPGIAETGVDQVLGLQPRDESAPTLDVLGNALQYTGEAPNPGQATGSACGTFDGVNDRILKSGGITSTALTSLTVSAWINPSASGQKGIVAEYNFGTNSRQWLFYKDASNKLHVVISSDGTYSASTTKDYFTTAAISNSVWTHVAFVFDGTNLNLYINGADQAVTKTLDAAISSIFNGTSDFEIGSYQNTQFFGGNMMDVRAYEDGLTDSEVSYVYSRGASGTDPGNTNLIGWWPLSENSGATAHDVSGNGNHGTITNATTTTGAGFWANTQDVSHWSLAKGFSRQNVAVTNSTFDNDVSGWTDNASVDSTHDTSIFVDGGLLLTLTSNTSTFTTQTLTGLTPNGGYRLSADLYTPSANTGTDVATIGVVALTFTSSNAISNDATDTIQRKQLDVTANGSGEITIYLSVVSANYSAFGQSGNVGYFDNVSVIGLTEVPALADGTADADGNTITNPARIGHNGGMTDLTLADGSWSFNDARSNPAFKRTLTESAVAVAADRFVTFSATLSGSDLTNMQTYTETTEI